MENLEEKRGKIGFLSVELRKRTSTELKEKI